MGMLNLVKKFAAGVLVFLISGSSAIAQTPDVLFTNRPEWVESSPHGISAHAASLNTALISRGVNSMWVQLPDGTVVQLERDGFEERGHGNLTWRGRVEGEPKSSATLTLKKGWVFGRIQCGGKVYEIKSRRGGKVVIEELDTGSFPECGGGVELLPEATDEIQDSGISAFSSLTPAGDASVEIDLLSVYTPQAKSAAGGASQIEAHIQAAVDAANTVFINSAMNVRFRLVHTAEFSQDDSGDIGIDLNNMRTDATVAALRNQYGADMVSLLTEDGGDSCGKGYTQRNPSSGFKAYAFQVTDMDCAVGNLSFAHEHGHNMGMEHNPEDSSAGPKGTKDPSYSHSFGHYFNGRYRTVMSYSRQCADGCPRVPHFSNPEITYDGLRSGVVYRRNNARTGDLTGPLVASFYATVEVPSADIRFAIIGDYGSDDSDFDERDVADLVASWSPDFVLTVGGNRYGSISMDSAVGKYYCDFLADVKPHTNCDGGNLLTNAFFPSLGDHDYSDGGGLNEYLNYFTLPGTGIETTGTSGNEEYYDFVQGPVHFFAVNSSDPLTFSAQRTWLEQQLRASTAPWQVVYFHHAAYSSSANHGSDITMQWPFASWGADAVISAHDHTYERLDIDGIPYFVNGLGGNDLNSFGTTAAGSQVRYSDDYGAMQVDASDTTITFRFINVKGTVIDTHIIEPGSNGVVDVIVAQSSDDAEELVDLNPSKPYLGGHMTLTSPDLEMAYDYGWHGGEQTVGIRFQNVNIPQGATILSAHLRMTTDDTGNDATTVEIRAQDSDNTKTFLSTEYDISSRPTTSTSVPWDVPVWGTEYEQHPTPNLKDVVQEVVNRALWVENNSMAFVITRTGIDTGTRSAKSYDGNSATMLHVEYERQQANQVPTAAFNYVTNSLLVNFTDTSTDSEGSVVSWYWDFGDGNTTSDQNPIHTYTLAGTYDVRLTVFDNEGATVNINHTVAVTDGSSDGVVDVIVAQSSDDAEELVDLNPSKTYLSGHMTLTSPDLEMAYDYGWHGGEQAVGIRFQNVNIPQGATILSAHLRMTTDDTGDDATTVEIRAQDSANAATFLSTENNISSRPTTSTSVPWDVPVWDTEFKSYTTPDLTAVVQEVVGRDLWVKNNSMAFVITGTGTRSAKSYDKIPAMAPMLHVEYEKQVADEIAGVGFPLAGDDATLSWNEQPGATEYELRRSGSPLFDDGPCAGGLTASAQWVDPAIPAPGALFHYLVRATQPFSGSWGARSDLGERSGICD